VRERELCEKRDLESVCVRERELCEKRDFESKTERKLCQKSMHLC